MPRGVLAAGEAKENDLAFRGEMRAGPRGEGVVGPTLEDDVSVRLRYQGLRESIWWWETVKEKREEEHAPILAVDDGSNRRDAARG